MEFLAGVLAAFAFGTVWFYIACVVTFFGIMALSESDHEIFAIFVLAGFVFLMERSGAFNIFADPLALLKWSVLYFVIGVVWSFAKWWSFVVKKAEEFVELRMYFLTNFITIPNNTHFYDGEVPERLDMIEVDSPITEKSKVPDTLTKFFLAFLRGRSFINSDQQDRGEYTPSALQNKSKITTWIIWWPTSALWTLLSDPMVRIANWIFSRLKGTYQIISNRAFAKFE